MKIDATRDGGSALLHLEGRLDREWAEQLSHALEDLLQAGVRSLRLDLAAVTYVSSAAAAVLARWRAELQALRGELLLVALSPAAREGFAVAGWDPDAAADEANRDSAEFRHSVWQARSDLAASGVYELAVATPGGTLACRLHGDPARLTAESPGTEGAAIVPFAAEAFGCGLGAIGADWETCRDRIGELVALAGCVAYFPTDGARLPDYLVGGGSTPPRALLASGIVCEGAYSHLLRFGPKPPAEAVPLSELAGAALEAVGGRTAGIVVAAETAGLVGARVLRSPAGTSGPLRFELPAVRDWLSFPPERTHGMTTVLIAGVVARRPEGPLARHLRPLGPTGRLFGHLHAAVFSYHALPQRTVGLATLARGLFADHQLRDVLHLIWDKRGDDGAGESALVRGVAWAGPIAGVVEGGP